MKINFLILFCLVGLIVRGQTDTMQVKIEKIVVYECKEFKVDTIAHKITFREETLFWIFDQDTNIVKKGYGGTVDIKSLIKYGSYYYLFFRRGNKQNPTAEELKEKAFLIKVK